MDVSFLNPVLEATGPFATVCADVTHTTENADAEPDLRVRAVAGQLTEQGAPDTVVEALRKGQVETLVRTDEPGDDTLLVGGSPLELGVRQQDMGRPRYPRRSRPGRPGAAGRSRRELRRRRHGPGVRHA